MDTYRSRVISHYCDDLASGCCILGDGCIVALGEEYRTNEVSDNIDMNVCLIHCSKRWNSLILG